MNPGEPAPHYLDSSQLGKSPLAFIKNILVRSRLPEHGVSPISPSEIDALRKIDSGTFTLDGVCNAQKSLATEARRQADNNRENVIAQQVAEQLEAVAREIDNQNWPAVSAYYLREARDNHRQAEKCDIASVSLSDASERQQYSESAKAHRQSETNNVQLAAIFAKQIPTQSR